MLIMDLHSALQELASDIKQEVLRRMSSDLGVNKKTGSNTLVHSDLYESVDTKVIDDNTIVFEIADYYTHVVGGRKPGWGVGPPHGFVQGVTNWVRKKGIRFSGKTENQTIWMCINSIVKYGIAARPFIGNGFINDDPAFVLPFLDEFFDKWADNVYNDIIKELDTFFN